VTSAAEHWRRALDAWALPDEIVNSAPQSPWIHPPVLFEVPDQIQPSPSHDRAREVLAPGGSVLDVGCGGGIAAFALTPPATHVIGVDHQPEMLVMFRANAAKRGVTCETVEGFWPLVAALTPVADVVTAHHVVYNVADLVPFLRALDGHARSRVVLEMPDRHPLASMSDAWRHFWNLERPRGPTPAELLDVLRELGIGARREQWSGPMRVEQNLDQAAHFMRIRLCLPESREDEVRDFLASNPAPSARELTTIWWDVASRDA
jgi:SAM-dependent methyltransferase